MEKSETDLIDGIGAMTINDPFPDELFYRILEIKDNIERTQFLNAVRNKAKTIGRAKEFGEVFKAFFEDYKQKMLDKGNVTHFTDQPLQLQCGMWDANDLGVSTVKYDKSGFPTTVVACSHPVLPIEILKNIDTGIERVTLAFFKYGGWQKVTVGREICADNTAIVKVLSRIGIEVTTENSKNLVRYISDCIGMNPVRLEPKRSINRLGWAGNEFMPYASDIVYDGDEAFEPIYRNIQQKGSYDQWKEYCGNLRKNKVVRLAFAASLASVLIERVNALPFVFHVWSGESGTGKTVAIMAAMSIWGNPKMGGLVKTMNTTKVNIMRTSAFLYSLPYAGDELQTMKDKWSTNFDQLIYQITEGIDRGRGKASGGVEETKTWKNSYLFTGEEPITKANSRAGSKNRVIEIEAEGKLIEDGNATVGFLTENYGYAGKELIEYLQGTETKDLQAQYREYYDAMCHLDTTEKQAMAMACILLADKILTQVVFTDEKAYEIEDISMYLRSAQEVDVAEQSYQMVLNWIAKNPVRFRDPDEADSLNRGEVWGKIEDVDDGAMTIATVNKSVLCDFLDKVDFDYAAVSKKWAEQNRIVKNSQGKFVHQTKVFSVKASYIKIIVSQNVDKDGFMTIDEEQEKLPFD